MSTVRERLHELRQRLLAANLRSRSLRLTRVTRSGAFDLSRLETLNRSSLSRIRSGLGEVKPFKVDLLPARGASETERDASEDIRRLANAAHRTWMEVGEDELLLGWPLIEGKFADTWLRAPLLLFPVTLARSRRGRMMWQLTIEGRPDANEVLTQALFRLAGVRLSLDRLIELDEDETLKPDDPSWSSLEVWLAEGGVELRKTGAGLPTLEPLEHRDREARDGYPDGQIDLRNQLILGRFPQSSSNVLSEYNELENRLDLLDVGPAAELLAIDLDTPIPEDGRATPAGDDAEGEPGEQALSPTDGDNARVLPSDASQEAVIRALDGLEGRGLVVRGPPGTGKSQLISNLVGQAIQRNERILVVCQKRAALDVVTQRLGVLGLEEPLALVHDVHHDRKAFTARLAQSLEKAINTEGQVNLADTVRDEKRQIAEAEANQKRVAVRLGAADQAYRRMMAVGPGGCPLAELFERALDDDGRQLPDLSDVAGELDEEEVIRALPDIETIAPDSEHFAAPHRLAVREHWSQLDDNGLLEIWDQLRELRSALHNCGGEADATMTPKEAAAHAALWEECSSVLDVFDLEGVEAQQRLALFWTFTDAGKKESSFRSLTSRLERGREELSSVPPLLYMASSERVIDWLAMLNELADINNKWWRFLLPKFWRLRKVPGALIERCDLGGSLVPEAVVQDLIRLCEQTLDWHQMFREVSGLIEEAPFFEFACSGQLDEIEAALEAVAGQRDRVDQILRIHKRLRSSHEDYHSLPDFRAADDYPGIPIIRASLADRREARNLQAAKSLAETLTPAFRARWLDALLVDAGRGQPVLGPLDEVIDGQDEATAVAAIDRKQADLPLWAREFLRYYRPDRESGSETLSSFDTGRLAVDLRLALERAWRTAALNGKSAAEAEAALVDETQRTALAEAYEQLIATTAPAVVTTYNQRLRRAAAQTEGIGRAMRRCLKDAHKKRYRLSIRQFVERFWTDGLALLRPVWLCSPESVAALFPLENGLFDRVVMDEASQCPVESALPALVRGKRLVVAGDEKQMPPSHFFATRDQDDLDEDDDSALLSAQSILDVSRVAYSGTMLRFHYRSRFEELITFSNHAFYEGRLVTAPPAEITKDAHEGMHFELVEGRWTDQTNRVEAERVVEVVLELLGQSSEDEEPPTVGVVTFNQKQRQLIEALLDERLLDDERAREVLAADRERPATETLFVKNIENVQGDERDIIVFSVGYGPQEHGGRVHARFGPVGVEGGENRLNVAVTRAKRGVRVIASFEPRHLDVSNTKHVGPKLFQAYLDYAQNAAAGRRSEVERVLGEVEKLTGEAGLALPSVSKRRVGMRVREALATRLESCGFDVIRDFGIGPYRLDLAIRDPDRGDRWACGVDCTRFLVTEDTIQRDVTEPAFWRRAGWRLFRVSPAMWLEKREEVIAAVVAAVEQ